MANEILLHHEIEQALFHEAAMLDERRFDEWLSLFDDEFHYHMPIRITRGPGDTAPEFTDRGAPAFFDDDRKLLAARIAKLGTGFSWAEDPASRTRHFVFNVRIAARPDPDEVVAECNFILYRSRLAVVEDFWVGSRRDHMRRRPDGWRLVDREIRVDQTVLESKDLSSFF